LWIELLSESTCALLQCAYRPLDVSSVQRTRTSALRELRARLPNAMAWTLHKGGP
jgi:hypothetical protein